MRDQINFFHSIVIFLFLLFFVQTAFSNSNVNDNVEVASEQSEYAKPSWFETLANETGIVNITITTELKKLVRKKMESNYQPMTLSFIDKKGEEIKYEGEVKARGKSRKRICFMPPLKLKFSKDEFKSKGLKKHNTYKLVTYCKLSKTNEDIVLKEYLVYKLHNKITPYGFRVQLAKVKYVDSRGKKKTVEKYGFIIENDEEMAARLDAGIWDHKNVKAKHTTKEHFNTLALFQYMVGNTDWQIRTLHNIKLLRMKDSDDLIVIPYDFDYSGLVNAPYAVPNSHTNLESVTDRLYMGYKESSSMQYIVDDFLNKETELLGEIENFDLLDKRVKKEMISYLEGFFKIMKSDKLRERVFK